MRGAVPLMMNSEPVMERRETLGAYASEAVAGFLERETGSAPCFVSEPHCGPHRLLLFHHDAVCFGCHREPICDARKLSAERAERQGGVGRARLRGMLGVDGHVEGA